MTERWERVYDGPLQYGFAIRKALSETTIPTWDPNDSSMGGRSGTGGHQKAAVHVPKGALKAALKIPAELRASLPEAFEEPPGIRV